MIASVVKKGERKGRWRAMDFILPRLVLVALSYCGLIAVLAAGDRGVSAAGAS